MSKLDINSGAECGLVSCEVTVTGATSLSLSQDDTKVTVSLNCNTRKVDNPSHLISGLSFNETKTKIYIRPQYMT